MIEFIDILLLCIVIMSQKAKKSKGFNPGKVHPNSLPFQNNNCKIILPVGPFSGIILVNKKSIRGIVFRGESLTLCAT